MTSSVDVAIVRQSWWQGEELVLIWRAEKTGEIRKPTIGH
jgi:hypothetical protein